MKTINLKEYGILPNTDITLPLAKMLKDMQSDKQAKIIEFESGIYHINSAQAEKPLLYVTNTMGDEEWKKGEEKNRNCVGILLENISNLTIDFGNSIFLIDGQMTNIAILNCDNVVIKNAIIKPTNPNMHEMKVIKKGLTYIDYKLDKDSSYQKDTKGYCFVGTDYKYNFFESRYVAYWTGKVPSDNINSVWRVAHPMLGAYKVTEIGNHTFRIKYLIAPNYKKGDRFYIYDARRKYQGIFIDRSKDIIIDNLEQNFNYGLCVVCQDSENFSLLNSKFCPAKDSEKLMASVADFVQICVCRGDIKLDNNYFEGAGDDTLNVHGIHYEYDIVDSKTINAKFSHKQTNSFCPIREGDTLNFISKESLNLIKTNIVVSAKLIDRHTIQIVLKNEVDKLSNAVIENASSCPNVIFSNNVMNRIITRGILMTTSGKVEIVNNRFENTSMHSILISDDAKSWYESGFVRDVLIQGNYFGRCVGYTLNILPENKIHKDYVHSNIRFIDNTIQSEGQGGYFMKSSKDITIKGNKIIGKTKQTKIINCDNINIED